MSLDIGPYCALSSMSPFRLPEPTAALLASSKTDASHKLGPQNDIVIYCV